MPGTPRRPIERREPSEIEPATMPKKERPPMTPQRGCLVLVGLAVGFILVWVGLTQIEDNPPAPTPAASTVVRGTAPGTTTR
jgi:hypothetical protein